jgi:hypothetical protein
MVRPRYDYCQGLFSTVDRQRVFAGARLEADLPRSNRVGGVADGGVNNKWP